MDDEEVEPPPHKDHRVSPDPTLGATGLGQAPYQGKGKPDIPSVRLNNHGS